jgi:predicted nucleic acid-binding protein
MVEARGTPLGQFHQIKRLEQYPVDPQIGLAESRDVRLSIAGGKRKREGEVGISGPGVCQFFRSVTASRLSRNRLEERRANWFCGGIARPTNASAKESGRNAQRNWKAEDSRFDHPGGRQGVADVGYLLIGPPFSGASGGDPSGGARGGEGEGKEQDKPDGQDQNAGLIPSVAADGRFQIRRGLRGGGRKLRRRLLWVHAAHKSRQSGQELREMLFEGRVLPCRRVGVTPGEPGQGEGHGCDYNGEPSSAVVYHADRFSNMLL